MCEGRNQRKKLMHLTGSFACPSAGQPEGEGRRKQFEGHQFFDSRKVKRQAVFWGHGGYDFCDLPKYALYTYNMLISQVLSPPREGVGR